MNHKYRILSGVLSMALWLPYGLGFAFELLAVSFRTGRDDVLDVLEELEERTADEGYMELWGRDN